MSVEKYPIQIAVLTNGFVFVGRVDPVGLVIHQAKNIRRWGTSKGLGEIAIGGPAKQTVLDETGIIRPPLHSLIFLIDCDEKKWHPIFP